MRAGGFLLKQARPAEIVQTLRSITLGDSLLFPAAIRGLAARNAACREAERLRRARLTEREAQVLGLMARGLTNAGIAAELVVTVETVKTHVGNVLGKLGCRGRTQAVIVAYESGFVARS